MDGSRWVGGGRGTCAGLQSAGCQGQARSSALHDGLRTGGFAFDFAFDFARLRDWLRGHAPCFRVEGTRFNGYLARASRWKDFAAAVERCAGSWFDADAIGLRFDDPAQEVRFRTAGHGRRNANEQSESVPAGRSSAYGRSSTV